jgi:hypothetical protein
MAIMIPLVQKRGIPMPLFHLCLGMSVRVGNELFAGIVEERHLLHTPSDRGPERLRTRGPNRNGANSPGSIRTEPIPLFLGMG